LKSAPHLCYRGWAAGVTCGTVSERASCHRPGARTPRAPAASQQAPGGLTGSCRGGAGERSLRHLPWEFTTPACDGFVFGAPVPLPPK
jgi:hypothetical protein